MDRTNKVYVIGTLLQVKDTRSGEKANSDGKNIPWIAGTAVVKSGDSEIEFKYYASAETQKGKANARYSNYSSLEEKVGDRVKVNGELSGRVWYNEGQAQIINFNEVSAGFFNAPKPTDEDTATFEFVGFVTKPIHERYDKEGEKLLAYEIELGQANYQQNNMQIVKFTVPVDSQRIYNAIAAAYHKDLTVSISGNIVYEVTIEEKTEEVAFGDPIVKKFQNTRKSFVITGGKQPIFDEGIAYSKADIAKLQSAYNEYLAQIEQEAKENKTVINNEPAKDSNASRLL